MHTQELVDDEEMAPWPLPPVLLTQVVRIVMKSGSEQMLQKVKELKVRAGPACHSTFLYETILSKS